MANKYFEERFIDSMTDGSQEVRQYGSPCPECQAPTRIIIIIYGFRDEPATSYVLYCRECTRVEY